MNPECSISLRVRYVECDAMGYLHHSHYLPYFEMGRTELLRQSGMSYRDLEKQGVFFVVVRISAAFRKPARYDDELTLKTKIIRQTHVRIDHSYELVHIPSGQLLCTAESSIACVDRAGKVIPIPATLAGDFPAHRAAGPPGPPGHSSTDDPPLVSTLDDSPSPAWSVTSPAGREVPDNSGTGPDSSPAVARRPSA